MDLDELLARYEALGEERDFLAAKPLYEQALAEKEDARLLNDYGYLLACHARCELRQATRLYARAIALHPEYDKPHYQLISACAGLGEAERAISMYEERLAANPTAVREHRFLAQAYIAGRAYAKAVEVAEAGLALAADDAALIAARGEARAGLGDVDGALADWRRALELEPGDIGALYSTAFLLERDGRLAEASDAWEAILTWSDARGYELDAIWPRQELERLRAEQQRRRERTS